MAVIVFFARLHASCFTCKIGYALHSFFLYILDGSLKPASLMFKGLLQDRLGLFFKLCEEERSVIFQSYMVEYHRSERNILYYLVVI